MEGEPNSFIMVPSERKSRQSLVLVPTSEFKPTLFIIDIPILSRQTKLDPLTTTKYEKKNLINRALQWLHLLQPFLGNGTVSTAPKTYKKHH